MKIEQSSFETQGVLKASELDEPSYHEAVRHILERMSLTYGTIEVNSLEVAYFGEEYGELFYEERGETEPLYSFKVQGSLKEI